jgi:hypothetical protein
MCLQYNTLNFQLDFLEKLHKKLKEWIFGILCAIFMPKPLKKKVISKEVYVILCSVKQQFSAHAYFEDYSMTDAVCRQYVMLLSTCRSGTY